MKTPKWLGAVVWLGAGMVWAAEVPEPELPRPGALVVTEITGEAFASAGDQPRKALKPEDRLRIGSTIATGRRSLATLTLSNGATLQLGSESEVEVEEFGQAPYYGREKPNEMKEEPTISRTRLRLISGDVTIAVKPLKVNRGSSFSLVVPAGLLRTGGGTFHARVRMSDLGLGVCTLEVKDGAGQFQLSGTETFAPVSTGRKLGFALEVDKTSGTVKVGELPKENTAAKK
jgi:hypothetical protein